MFSITPEVFYTVYMIFIVSKLIFRVLRSVVCFGSIIDESVISFPVIIINNALVQIAKFGQYGYQLICRAVFNYLGIDFTVHAHSKYRLLSACASASFLLTLLDPKQLSSIFISPENLDIFNFVTLVTFQGHSSYRNFTAPLHEFKLKIA